ETEPDIVQRPDGRIQLAGRVLIDEVNELFGFGFRTDEAETMAGLVVNALGRIASVGDEVEINGFPIRVEKVDRLRIDTLLLSFPAGKAAETLPSIQAD
ncbi:MAG: transporter associated domain-containing protein, partial [Anaerolineales bacterium]